MLESITNLFADQAFQHWFFWTGVTFIILIGLFAPIGIKIHNYKREQ